MSQPRYRHDQSIPDSPTAAGPVRRMLEMTPSLADGLTAPHSEARTAALFQISAGTLIGGRYEILGGIGAGGMGEVWRARDRQLLRVVALKRIKPEFAGDKTLLDRFYQEAFAVAALNHPHIVQIFDRGSDAAGEFFVMEFVNGPSLSRLLAEQGAFDLERTVQIGQAMCAALQATHDKGILHRDVKPGNILLGERDVPKLTDFGLARRENADDHSLTKGGIGTPLYMSPEQHELSATLTPSSDQWSLGATLYHLATGHPPRIIWANRIPELLRATLMRAVDADPQQRFPTMRQFGEALAEVLTPIRHRTTTTTNGTDLASIVQAMQTRVNEAHTEAQRLIEEDHDYATAAEVLSEIPEHLRKGALLRLATTRRERVAELDREIEQRSRELRLQGLPPLIQELLNLQPERAELRRLLETVQAAEPASAVSVSRPTLLKAPFGPSEIKESREAWSRFLGQPIEITNSIGLKLILIPPGEFQMGASDDEPDAWKDERPRHRVLITKPIYVGVELVTQGDWAEVMGGGKGAWSFPKNGIHWHEAHKFALELSRKPDEKSAGRTYRLPTEAEWEYFCRAGTETPFWFGSVLNGREANVDGRQPYGTLQEGSFHEMTTKCRTTYGANPFGLFDVHGNLWEWCKDAYDEAFYERSPREDPCGPSSGERRVVRGGGYRSNCFRARSSARGKCEPSERSYEAVPDIGCRVVSPVLHQDS